MHSTKNPHLRGFFYLTQYDSNVKYKIQPKAAYILYKTDIKPITFLLK